MFFISKSEIRIFMDFWQIKVILYDLHQEGEDEYILPEYQEFIVQLKLAPKKQAPYYAHWVSKFLRYSNTRQDISLDLRIQMFPDDLKKDKKSRLGNSNRLITR